MGIKYEGMTEEESAIAEQYANGLVGDEALTTPTLRQVFLDEPIPDKGVEDDLEVGKQELDQESESVNTPTTEKEPTDPNVVKEEKKPLKQALFESKNEANTLRQKAEAQKKKLRDPAYLKKIIEENNIDVSTLYTPISKENLYADETIENIIDANNDLNERLSKREKAEEIIDAKADANVKMFSDIYALQDEFPSIKTDMDISDINDLFVKHGSHNVPDEKLLEDGLSQGDLEKFRVISASKSTQAKEGYKSIRSAYFEKYGVNEMKLKANANLGDEINKRQIEALKKVNRVSGGFSNEEEVESRGRVSETFIKNLIEKEARVGYEWLNKEERLELDKYLDSN